MPSTFLLICPYEQGMTKSHLVGLLDLARRLLARGHRVLVYTPADARAEVEAAGAELVPHQRYVELGARMRAGYEAMPPWLRRSRLLRIPRMLYEAWRFRSYLLDSARDFAEELEPLLRREGVDCVVQDFLAYGASYAAERVGIPCVTTSHAGGSLDSNGLPLELRASPPGRWLGRRPRLVHRVLDLVLPLRRVREELGLPPREARHAEFLQAMVSPQLHLVTVHPGFLKGLPLRDHQLCAGPSIVSKAQETSEPVPLPVPGTVLVSTTTVGGDGGLLRRVLEALAPMGVPVLATTTRDTDVPPNLGAHVRVERFVPHEQILPHVAAVVTHGGMGMVGRALRHGVPMLIIPLFADQPLNAQLAEQQGLAYRLPFPLATPEAIRERVRALLEDQPLRERLKQTAVELQELGAKCEDLEALERLARETSERRAAAQQGRASTT